MVITVIAPVWPIASAANPMASGKIVPPKSPMIIRPETSFFSLGTLTRAREKITEKTFELPKPISAIPIYMGVNAWHTNSIAMATSIIATLMPKKTFGDMERSRKAPKKQPMVRKMK